MTTFINDLPPGFGKQVVSCRLESIQEIVEAATFLQSDYWCYRGHYIADWSLTTSLERKFNGVVIDAKAERNAIADFQNLTWTLLPHVERLVDTLAAMQHYGVPTRLLDFSRSFLVALHFAFDRGLNNENLGDHAIWAINTEIAIQNSEPIRQSIHDEIENNKDQIERIGSTVPCDMEKVVFDSSFDELRMDAHARIDRTTELAEWLLRGSAPHFESGILPIDIRGTNLRIAAQNGMFIMTTDFSSFENSLANSFGLHSDLKNMEMLSLPQLRKALFNETNLSIIKFLVPDTIKGDVKRLLSAANISYARLFPDLSGIASSIHYI